MNERPIIMSAPMVRAIFDGRKAQTRRIVTRSTSTVGTGVPWSRLCWGENPAGLEVFADSGSSGFAGGAQYLHVPCRPHPDDPQDEPDWWSVHRVYPRWEPGDRLWLRETWAIGRGYDGAKPSDIDPAATFIKLAYAADGAKPEWAGRWRAGRFMPRWASRITLELTGIRVERLQEISEEDAQAEGIELEIADQTLIARDYSTPNEFFQAWTDLEPRYVEVETIARESFRTLWQSLNAKRAPWESNPWVWVLEFRSIDQ